MTDTSLKASKFYFDRLAAMTPSERLRIGMSLWEAGQTLQWSKARRNHPDADNAELAFHVAVSRFGPNLARAICRKS
jgi:hypothetical protein